MMQILFLGPPGAGKGTQCQRLAGQLKLPHLSSGDLLREAVKTGTDAGITAKGYMDKGQLVPDAVLINMFGDKLSQPECHPEEIHQGFILDGFPRNVAQAEALDQLLTKLDKNLNIVVNLQVDEKLLTERIVGRRTCSNKTCNQVYHIKFKPPQVENVCDRCGSPLTQRSDDTEALVSARLKTYHEQTSPLIRYYTARKLLRTINGNGREDQIFRELLKAVMQVPV
jgi:adenylate kinase